MIISVVLGSLPTDLLTTRIEKKSCALTSGARFALPFPLLPTCSDAVMEEDIVLMPLLRFPPEPSPGACRVAVAGEEFVE